VILTTGQLALHLVGSLGIDFSGVTWERTLEVNGAPVTDFLRKFWPVKTDPLHWPPSTGLTAVVWDHLTR
jgi:hypothetical protein